MGRQMWPYAAVCRYAVRGTYEQAGAWDRAARVKGLRTPVFLALAADVYAEHLERLHARLERAEQRRKAREARG
jgi:hypothetical protein